MQTLELCKGMMEGEREGPKLPVEMHFHTQRPKKQKNKKNNPLTHKHTKSLHLFLTPFFFAANALRC